MISPRIKEGMIYIYTDEGVYKQRRGYIWEPVGLGFHYNKKKGTYTVDHLSSGRRIVYRIPDYSLAISILLDLYRILPDWNFTYSSLISNKEIYTSLLKKVMRVVHKYEPYGVTMGYKHVPQ